MLITREQQVSNLMAITKWCAKEDVDRIKGIAYKIIEEIKESGQ